MITQNALLDDATPIILKKSNRLYVLLDDGKSG